MVAKAAEEQSPPDEEYDGRMVWVNAESTPQTGEQDLILAHMLYFLDVKRAATRRTVRRADARISVCASALDIGKP
jgi:hypothetical protein